MAHCRFVPNTYEVYESRLSRISERLIKSKLIFVHRRVLVCFLDTVSRLEAKIVLTS